MTQARVVQGPGSRADVAHCDKCFLLKLVDVVELELARLGLARARVAACQREMRLTKRVGEESKTCYV